MDKAIIIKIKAGDKRAFSQLYNEYAEEALRVAMAIVKEKFSASDAVQETFIRVYNNIDSYNQDKPFRPWFYKILVNECRRVLNVNSKTILISDFVESGLQNSKRDEYNFEEYEDLYKAIGNLDDTNRIPIILKYLKGLSENDIAQILDLNVNTVKSRLFKGRQKLKKFLQLFDRGSERHG